MHRLQYLDVSNNQMVSPPLLRTTSMHELGSPEDASSSYLSEEELPPVEDEAPLQLNLRYNNLSGHVSLASLQNVTDLDVSENAVRALDLRGLRNLRRVRCANNGLLSLALHGAKIVALHAANNELEEVEVSCHPRHLKLLDLSSNLLTKTPPWLVSCERLEHLDLGRNFLTRLPGLLFSGHLPHLSHLAAPHNNIEVVSLPAAAAWNAPSSPQSAPHEAHRDADVAPAAPCGLQVLLLQHNQLASLPPDLLACCSRLRVLNVSSNELSALPPTGVVVPEGVAAKQWLRATASAPPYPTGTPASRPMSRTVHLQEVYLGNNNVRDLSSLQACRGLRVLYAAHNRISQLPDKLIWSWELLEELVVSGNHLSRLPSGVSRLRRLRVLRAHSNPLTGVPRLAHLPDIQVVDVSHCQLGQVELEDVVSPSMVALDLSANPSLTLDHLAFDKCKSRRRVSVVDATCRLGRALPFRRSLAPRGDAEGTSDGGEGRGGGIPQADIGSDSGTEAAQTLPWTFGFSESVGRSAKLTAGQLRVPDLGSMGTTGLTALADAGPGDADADGPSSIGGGGGTGLAGVTGLLALLPGLLQDERACAESQTHALKYALLAALRTLTSQGRPLPPAAAAAHLEDDLEGSLLLRVASWGQIKAVLTSAPGSGHDPVVLTARPDTGEAMVTSSFPPAVGPARLDRHGIEGLGRAPGPRPAATIPDPQSTEIALASHHRNIVIANSGVWGALDAEEVSGVCDEITDPVLAAKRIVDLAQSYGAITPLSVIVIRLVDPGRCRRGHPGQMVDDRWHSGLHVGNKRWPSEERRSTFGSKFMSQDMANGHLRPDARRPRTPGTRCPEPPGKEFRGLREGVDLREDHQDSWTNRHRRYRENLQSRTSQFGDPEGRRSGRGGSRVLEGRSHQQHRRKTNNDTEKLYRLSSARKAVSYEDLLEAKIISRSRIGLSSTSVNDICEQDRSSPSGQSQSDRSDWSENGSETYDKDRGPRALRSTSVTKGLQKQAGDAKRPIARRAPPRPDPGHSALKPDTRDSGSGLDAARSVQGHSASPNENSTEDIYAKPIRKWRTTSLPDTSQQEQHSKRDARVPPPPTPPRGPSSYGRGSAQGVQRCQDEVLSRKPTASPSPPVISPGPITYYHYPRPDPERPRTLEDPEVSHVNTHLLRLGSNEQIENDLDDVGYVAPPAGFGDDSEVESDNDSGLSGLETEGPLPGSLAEPGRRGLRGNGGPNDEEVSEEQFRSWEYLLARNAKVLFLKELDTLASRRPSSKGARVSSSVSTPDLVGAVGLSSEITSPACEVPEVNHDSSAEGPDGGHFQRNAVRKSRFGRGTLRAIQHKLQNTGRGFSTFQRLRTGIGNFKRFGSLQNLKYYREHRPHLSRRGHGGSPQLPRSSHHARPPHYAAIQMDLESEMQERPSLDSLELETRMQQYWQAGVTNF